jgi:uncharacterized protein
MTQQESNLAAEHMLFGALDNLKRGDTDAWVAMFHDDGVMEFPYAPPDMPQKLNTKSEVADYMKGYNEHVSIRTVKRRAVYHTGNTMVVEFSCEGNAVSTGNKFAMDYISVIMHQAGRIKHYRDYWNPLVAQKAMGIGDAATAASGEGNDR